MNTLVDLQVLYVEDDRALQEQVAYALRHHFARVMTADNGQQALELIRNECPDVVVSDIRMPVLDGLHLAAHLKTELPQLPVVLCTALHETDHLLRAIELGVAGYVAKPIDFEKLRQTVEQAGQPCLAQREIVRLRAELSRPGQLPDHGSSMRPVAERLLQVASTQLSILLTGEAGTGKSFFAGQIHAMSTRRTEPLLTVACRGRTPEQLDRELFGESKGRGRPGAGATELLSAAHGGTLVLDEPEHLPTVLQQRFLRLLEDGSYVPNGAMVPVLCNLRVVTLTTANLDRLVQEGSFSGELLLRLADVPLCLPTLRERRTDLPQLARFFLAEAADEFGRTTPLLTAEAEELLTQHGWPGNVRELQQLMRRALILAGNPIQAASLAPLFGTLATNAAPGNMPSSLKLSDLEQWAIGQALLATGGKKLQAARLLGISYNAFKDKLRRIQTADA